MPAFDTIDWAALDAKLPTERTDDEKAQRADLFRRFDPNGNRILSLAEVDKGLTDLGVTPEPFNKKVILRAFQAAKGANNDAGAATSASSSKKSSSLGADYIEPCEFRLLLVYLKQYFKLWKLFDAVDESNDHRISLEEFKSAVANCDWLAPEIRNDPDAAFQEMDANGGGMLLFDEFAAWALKKHLDAEDKSQE